MFDKWMNSPFHYPGIDLAWEAQEWDLPVVGLFQFLTFYQPFGFFVLFFVLFCFGYLLCCFLCYLLCYSMLFVLMLSGTEFFDCANGLKVMVI